MTMWTGPSIRISIVEFAKKAHAYFVEFPGSYTFTTGGDIRCGELFAVRWAFNGDKTYSVLVFEVGSTPVLVEEF